MSDNLLLDIIARSIGRTITQENYRQRAADVLRSVKENDLTLPRPTNLIEHEVTRLRADNERLREVLRPFADRINLLDECKNAAKYAVSTDINVEHLRRARDAYNNTK